ncbi:hypothetical protein C4544_07185 [candidate division WS5 bacterium]|uniref:Uncharacterized protein n=1 Tax=candidate division WS5 bacterium TaxID=2093353 RepID=A0A419DAM8_9BACT|nr:MAG: hypothetical protein C4544_07185 [candidate division WS5 bacterium]
MKKQPLCILFAGPVGSSKTPVAVYLSWNLGLPIFNTDAIRTEVLEDILENNLESELIPKRRDERLAKMISSKKSFIYDASIDRTWPEMKKELEENGYKYFVISFDITNEFLKKLWNAKKYDAWELFDGWCEDHLSFVKKYREEVGLTITDDNFSARLDESLEAVRKFLGDNS